MQTNIRNIELRSILSLVSCAFDFGHANGVCMSSLYEWAKPVTDEDIENYGSYLAEGDGYGEGDKEEAIEILTEWRDKHVKK